MAATIELPDAGKNSASIADRGLAIVDHRDGSVSVPVPHTDGSVQIATVINGPEAPTSFAYSVHVEGAAEVTITSDGSVLYLDSAGKYLAGVVAPWARDASGRELSTRFVLDGTKLIQIVEHKEADVVYPVVADPWLGVDLFGSVRYGTYRNQPTVSIAKSLYGQYLHVPTNNWIFLTAGWAELDTKDWRNYMNQKWSMHEQYDCHVAGGYFNFAGATWDFEMVRPNTLNGWAFNVLNHRCNWNYANGLV